MTDDSGKFCGSFSGRSSAYIKTNSDLNPSIGTFMIECTVKPGSPDGVIVSAGSQVEGWAVFLQDGKPGFVVAHSNILHFVDGVTNITGKWCHLVAVIENYHGNIRLYADGELIGQRQMLLPEQTEIITEACDITVGQDSGDLIDPKEVSNHRFRGLIQQVTFYRERMSESKIKELSMPL
jgi:hypothetical protein